ncbi:LLM class flavin-dependent oxidoreductase [Streptomyces sp. NBC_01167]|uniref:LLM class flavin-dependent oxidoreductase n=1 Tax=Streptomyces sp. NBC_01167 TaxID=2903756 RepID=UPI0038704163|nr:LLM class flavin-dependent oxidoreductase [Streptomyces sp. NBC_01167]
MDIGIALLAGGQADGSSREIAQIANDIEQLGLSALWLPEHVVTFEQYAERRGTRAEDYIEAMNCLWRDTPATYQGEFVSFQNVIALPKPIQKPRPPILIGGNSRSALHRVARYGDGWMSAMLPSEQIPLKLAQLEAECAMLERRPESIRHIHLTPYTTNRNFQEYHEQVTEIGKRAELAIAVLPQMLNRSPREVIAEIAQLASRMDVR